MPDKHVVIRNQLEAEIQGLTYELTHGWHRGCESAIKARIQALYDQLPPPPPRPPSYPRRHKRKPPALKAGPVESYSPDQCWLYSKGATLESPTL